MYQCEYTLLGQEQYNMLLTDTINVRCLRNIHYNQKIGFLYSEHFKSQFHNKLPDSKVHGANMGPIWVLLAPGGPQVGPINLATRDGLCLVDPASADVLVCNSTSPSAGTVPIIKLDIIFFTFFFTYFWIRFHWSHATIPNACWKL